MARCIDADKLYEEVTKKYCDIVAGCYPYNIVAYDMARMVKNAPTVDVAPKSEWISVGERLPDKGGYYLICQKSDLWFDEIIQTARWNNKNRKFRGAQAGCFMEYVTHWMPLPSPPEGGSQ